MITAGGATNSVVGHGCCSLFVYPSRFATSAIERFIAHKPLAFEYLDFDRGSGRMTEQREKRASKKRPRNGDIASALEPSKEALNGKPASIANHEAGSTLSGIAAHGFPMPAEVSRLNNAQQTEFISKTAELSERAIFCIDSGIAAMFTQGAPHTERGSHDGSSRVPSIEDAVLADMVRLRNLPVAREYVEMTLWRRLRNANAKAIASVEEICEECKLSTSKSIGSEQIEVRRDELKSVPTTFRTFKELHMQTLTEVYAADLERLRSTENMDGDKVQFLLRCLEAGAELFEALSASNPAKHEKVECGNVVRGN